MDDFGILHLTSHYWALLVKMCALPSLTIHQCNVKIQSCCSLLNIEHGLNKGVIWVEPTDHPDIDTSRYFGEQEGKKEVMCDIIM